MISLLAAGDLRAEIRPEIGGSLAGFWSERAGKSIDWLRRADPAGIAAADARAMACYPLVPFSNRIRSGKFSFGGKDISLPLNHLPHPHFIHGHGWRAPWQVVEKTGEMARLRYRHVADAWPWSYLAEQTFSLSDQALSVEIALTNLAGEPMPAGIGLHPYFPRGADSEIMSDVKGLWESDGEVMPTRLVPAGTVWPPGKPLKINDIALDNCFTGWRRTLDIRWPDTGRMLRVEASEPLDFLVVFTPPGEDFFCAEPVSHMIDAFNLARNRDDTGTVVLDPGDTLAATVKLLPYMNK